MTEFQNNGQSAGQRFMQKLDEWTEVVVCYALGDAWLAHMEAVGEEAIRATKARIREAEAEVKKAIRTKVLESYRNGLKAGPKKENKQQK